MSLFVILFRPLIPVTVLAAYLGSVFLLPCCHAHPGERHDRMSADLRLVPAKPVLPLGPGIDGKEPSEGASPVRACSDGIISSARALHSHGNDQNSFPLIPHAYKRYSSTTEAVYSLFIGNGWSIFHGTSFETIPRRHNRSYFSDLSPPFRHIAAFP